MVNLIQPLQLFERLENNEEFYLVDVREQAEFASHRIAKSLFNPKSAFDLTQVKTDLPIIFICRSGNRSGIVAELFLKHFPDATIYNLEGGLLAWEAASLPLERNNS